MNTVMTAGHSFNLNKGNAIGGSTRSGRLAKALVLAAIISPKPPEPPAKAVPSSSENR